MTEQVQTQPARRVGLLLGIGIFVIPIVFAWFTLRKGHSTTARVVSFVWMVISIGIAAVMPGSSPTTQQASTSAAAPAAAIESVTPEPRKGRVDMAAYSQLQTGMSYEQAVEILGKPGTELSSNEIGGTRTVLYQWDAGFGANMNAMFQDGQLIQKAQFGLR